MSDQPCHECPIHTWAIIRSNAEAERAIRREERSELARLVRASMTTNELRQLAECDRPLLALLARSLMQAIADREAAA